VTRKLINNSPNVLKNAKTSTLKLNLKGQKNIYTKPHLKPYNGYTKLCVETACFGENWFVLVKIGQVKSSPNGNISPNLVTLP
jgi:hypothetical protein